jgi:hypothetical protein
MNDLDRRLVIDMVEGNAAKDLRDARAGHRVVEAVALPEVRVGVQIQQGLEGPGRSRRAVAQRAEGASLAASADIGPVGEDDMTAVGRTLGDPGLEHPARAGRRDVPTGLARGSGLGNSHRSSAGARASGPVRQEADPGPRKGPGSAEEPSQASGRSRWPGNRSPALRIMTVRFTALLRSRGERRHGAPREVRGCPERALRDSTFTDQRLRDHGRDLRPGRECSGRP